MNLTTASIFAAASVLGLSSLITSCSNAEQLTGAWQGNPTRITVPGAEYATNTITLDFAPDQSNRRAGTLNISATMDVQQAVNTTIDNTFNQPYTTSIAATASITGQYSAEKGDDDDILVHFDPSTFAVNIDPDGVTFSENILTDAPQATLDSITTATVERWRAAISSALQAEFGKYSKIEDIKIHHDNMMSCEIADRDETFRLVQ
ncbi:MAG: hypothetical protein HDS72_09575 [Bacteroidales bacterium]|nr:hypothetical protein [Bacteroidales bacterium]